MVTQGPFTKRNLSAHVHDYLFPGITQAGFKYGINIEPFCLLGSELVWGLWKNTYQNAT